MIVLTGQMNDDANFKANVQIEHIPRKGETIVFKGTRLLVVDIIYNIDYSELSSANVCEYIIIKVCQ